MALAINTIASLLTAASLGGITLAAAPASYVGGDSNGDRIEVAAAQTESTPDPDGDRGVKARRKLPHNVAEEEVAAALAQAERELSPEDYARLLEHAERAGALPALRAVAKWKHHDHAHEGVEREHGGKGEKARKERRAGKERKGEKERKPEKERKGEKERKPEKANKVAKGQEEREPDSRPGGSFRNERDAR